MPPVPVRVTTLVFGPVKISFFLGRCPWNSCRTSGDVRASYHSQIGPSFFLRWCLLTHLFLNCFLHKLVNRRSDTDLGNTAVFPAFLFAGASGIDTECRLISAPPTLHGLVHHSSLVRVCLLTCFSFGVSFSCIFSYCHLRSLLSNGGWFFLWSFVVLF